ncbi:hypothetical protein HXX01_00610 [Candidatus Nomurabacteria bacterium]|nr:hypothetical protein [Candidatus Nomurabacteria bacterium]
MEEKPKKLLTPFTIINIVLFIAVISNCFYFFYIKKDFNFIVETSCDLSKEQCFARDCTNLDDCPPNGLSLFKKYSLKANNFKYCLNEDCKAACESGQIKCDVIPCVNNPEIGESCSILNK